MAYVGVALVLVVLLVTNQLAFILGRAAEGQIPASAVLELVWLSLRENTTIILPVALMLGIVIALGRLYHDSELAAAQACGIGPSAIFVPVAIIALATASLSAWIAFIEGPQAAARTFNIRSEAIRTQATRGLAPGRFRSLGSGAVLYFESRDAEGLLHDVFFQRRVRPRTQAIAAVTPPQAATPAQSTATPPAPATPAAPATPPATPAPAGAADLGRLEIVTAKAARYDVSPDGDLYTVVLYDGKSYEGVPGQAAWRMVSFREQTVPVRTPESASSTRRTDLLPTATLLSSTLRTHKAELHWRIAMPLMVLLLAGLAVPLGKLRPRQGRYARVAWVVILYAVYANFIIAGRTWIGRGVLPAWLGLWWAHALVLACGLAIIAAPRIAARRRYRGTGSGSAGPASAAPATA